MHWRTNQTQSSCKSTAHTCMHWKIAECSLSAGKRLTLCFAARGSTYGPPAMSVSLFARQMSLPASMAATVGWSPAHPTIPAVQPQTLKHSHSCQRLQYSLDGRYRGLESSTPHDTCGTATEARVQLPTLTYSRRRFNSVTDAEV